MKRFIVDNGMRGACYYSTLALRHYLASVHQIEATAVHGFVRLPDISWSPHMWLEHDGRRTDVALHYPLPPVPAGPLVIDSDTVAPGAPFIYSATMPTDGNPLLHMVPGPEMARRQAEFLRFRKLATADLDTVGSYLSGAPPGMYAALQRVWESFQP